MSLLGVVLRRGGLIAALGLATCPALARAELSWSEPVFLNVGQPAAMAALACPASSQCTAVDDQGKEATFDPASATKWSAFAVDAQPLDAVACPTVNECVAVDEHGGEVTFDPRAVSTGHLSRIDQGHALESISCPSASQCTAADSSGHVVTFDPESPGTATSRSLTTAQLAGISCPSVSRCTVIDTGSSATGFSIEQSRLITFDPAVPASAPRQLVLSGLEGQLACPVATECVAIAVPSGCESFCGGTVTFDPTSTQIPATVSRSPLLYLSLACSSAGQCSAMDLSGREVTFDPTTTGTLTQAPVDAVGDFPKGENRGEIACPSESLCAVVSDSGMGSGEMTFNPRDPGTPSIATIDDGAPAIGLSCPTSSECILVARVTDLYLPGPVGASVTLNPRTGSSGTGRSPLGGDPAGLSCPTSRQCTMVTKRARSCSECVPRPGGEEWTYNPRGPGRHTFRAGQRLERASLSAVACPTAIECVAVDTRGLAISFNPRHPRHPARHRLAMTALTGIACLSARQCVAADRTGQVVLFDPVAAGRPARTRIDAHRVLTGLSCPSVEQCTAIDAAGFQITFNPATGTRVIRHRVAGQGLVAISCPSTTRCVATSSKRTFTGNPHAGGWSQSTPPGATSLADVVCRPRGRCVVVDGAGHAYISWH